MKVLTLTQPWASLVACGAKRIETRPWRTRYRGPVAIHAAQAMPRAALDFYRSEVCWSALHRAGVPDAAKALGKAASGSQDGITLAESFGISKREMIQAGAHAKFSGAIALDSAQDIAALQDALERLIKAKYGDGTGLPRGAVLAVVTLTECVPTQDLQGLSATERAFGDYRPGRWAWLLEDLRPLPSPVDAPGSLGLWTPPPELLERLLS